MSLKGNSPTTFTNKSVVINPKIRVKYTLRFNALNFGGLVFNSLGVFSTIKTRQGRHNFGKQELLKLLNFLNYLWLFIYPMIATSYRFCVGGIACASDNVVYQNTFATEMIAESKDAKLWNIYVGHLIYLDNHLLDFVMLNLLYPLLTCLS